MSPFTGYTRGWAVKSITNNQSQRGWHGEEREDTDAPPSLVPQWSTLARALARAAEAFRCQWEKRLVMPAHEPDNLQHLHHNRPYRSAARL